MAEEETLHGRTTEQLAERIAMGYLEGKSSRAEIVEGMQSALQGDDAARRQLRTQLLHDVTDARDKARFVTPERINSDPRAVDAIRDLAEIDARWGGSNGLISRAVRQVDEVLKQQGDWLQGWPEVNLPRIVDLADLERRSGNWDAPKWEAEADVIDDFMVDELERARVETDAPSDLSSGREALRLASQGMPPMRASAAATSVVGTEQTWDRARARVVDQAPLGRAEDFGR